jgi:hypothetical protein
MIENTNVWSLSVVATGTSSGRVWNRGFCVMKDFDASPRFVDPVTFEERDYRFVDSNRADFSGFKVIASFRTFLAALGYAPGAYRDVDINDLSFRFNATTTNGGTINVIGTSDAMTPLFESNNQVVALADLHSDYHFNALFTQIANWL